MEYILIIIGGGIGALLRYLSKFIPYHQYRKL